MLSFEKYAQLSGKLTETEFNEFSAIAYSVVDAYIRVWISEDYDHTLMEDLGDFDIALKYEVDQLAKCGSEGITGMPSESSIDSVETSGFKISYDKSNKKYFVFDGLPFSPLSKILIEQELRKNGYMNRVVKHV